MIEPRDLLDRQPPAGLAGDQVPALRRRRALQDVQAAADAASDQLKLARLRLDDLRAEPWSPRARARVRELYRVGTPLAIAFDELDAALTELDVASADAESEVRP